MSTYPVPVYPRLFDLANESALIFVLSSASYKTPLSPLGVGLEVGVGVGMVGPGAKVGGLVLGGPTDATFM